MRRKANSIVTNELARNLPKPISSTMIQIKIYYLKIPNSD